MFVSHPSIIYHHAYYLLYSLLPWLQDVLHIIITIAPYRDALSLVAASSPWLAAWEQTLRDGNKRIETLIVCCVFTVYRHHHGVQCPEYPSPPHPRWGRANINPPSSTTHWSHCHVSPPLRWKCSRILALTILLNSVWRGICGENVRIAIKNFRLINPESGKIFDSVLSQQQPGLWLTFTMRRRMIYTLTEKLPFLLLQSLHCIYEYLYIDIENKEYPYKRK